MIDWHQQWQLFAHNFYDGHAHIDLSPSGTLLLAPGPGFGDLSHPTTSLMLEMMRARVSNEHILDLGTGSGILALAALRLGAKSAFGIDIDPNALIHARANAKLNALKARFGRAAPTNLPAPNIVLLNMISSEQEVLRPEQWNPQAKLFIVSGILNEQKEQYLLTAQSRNWRPLSEHSRSGWLGWIFRPQI